MVLQVEPEPPRVPMDYSWAKSLGLIRKPAEFVTSITDERGEELLYAGMPISKVFEVWSHASLLCEDLVAYHSLCPSL